MYGLLFVWCSRGWMHAALRLCLEDRSSCPAAREVLANHRCLRALVCFKVYAHGRKVRLASRGCDKSWTDGFSRKVRLASRCWANCSVRPFLGPRGGSSWLSPFVRGCCCICHFSMASLAQRYRRRGGKSMRPRSVSFRLLLLPFSLVNNKEHLNRTVTPRPLPLTYAL